VVSIAQKNRQGLEKNDLIHEEIKGYHSRLKILIIVKDKNSVPMYLVGS
jgi:hypothetical protein